MKKEKLAECILKCLVREEMKSSSPKTTDELGMTE